MTQCLQGISTIFIGGGGEGTRGWEGSCRNRGPGKGHGSFATRKLLRQRTKEEEYQLILHFSDGFLH